MTTLVNSRILVIDDDEDIRSMFTVALKSEGHQVDAVDSAKAAQTYLRRTVPDLIIMDVMMPDINGLELCRWVRDQESTRHVPVIQMSALLDETTAQDSMEMGAIDFLPKPVELKDLFEKVKLAIDRSRRRQEKT